jgi:hypothetical protein
MTERPRVDLSSFEAGRVPVESAPSVAAVEAHHMAARRSGEVRLRLQDVVGTAAGDGGRVTAEVAARGLCALTISPQAMRLPAQDLAAEIIRVSDLAREDLERQRAEALADAGIAVGQVDLDEVSAQLDELASGVRRDGANIREVVERFRTKLGH